MTGFTGEIYQDDSFANVATVTGVTLTSGKTYNMQIQRQAWIKLGDSEFFIDNEKFDYKVGTETLQIKTSYNGCKLTIHEVE